MAKTKKQHYLNNPNLPIPGALFEYTPEQIKEVERCKDDFMHFAQNHFFIINLDEGRQKIKLHAYQKRILRKMRDSRFFILLSSRQAGKALDINTPINTPSGWTTMGDLKDGDIVYGSDGAPCNVVKAHDIMIDRDCYEIEFDNGEKIVADKDHLWFTQTKEDRRKKNKGSVKTTWDILNSLKSGDEPNHRIPCCIKGVEGNKIELPIDPYILGLWLGDGNSSQGTISVGRGYIDEILSNLNSIQTRYSVSVKKWSEKACYTVRLGMISGRKGAKKEPSLTSDLKTHNLLNNKHIPAEYLICSRQQRLQLLKGLIDSDGYVLPSGEVRFTNTNIKLAHQVEELVQSLGYKTYTSEYTPKLKSKECNKCIDICFTPREPVCTLQFKLLRNQNKISNNEEPESPKRAQWFYIKNIKLVESRPVRCITVDSKDNLFLCGKSLIPTHNTTLLTIYTLWLLCFSNDQRVVIVANKEATAIEIFKRVRLAYEELPPWLKPGVVEYGKTSMKLANGSESSISTTTGSAARGLSINLLILDELAFIEPASILEDFWRSVYPTISSSKKSKIFISSTPNGVGNLFHKIWSGAVSGENGFECDEIKWNEIPGRDDKWKAKQIKNLGSYENWLQEYENIFLQFGDGGIDYEFFDNLVANITPPVHIYEDGHYIMYKEPAPERIYVAGVDTAEGIGKDSSIINIYDITNLQSIEQVAIYAHNKMNPYEFTAKCHDILKQWGRPYAFIERNGVGSGVVDNLRFKFGYEKIVNWGGKAANRKEQNGIICHTNTKYKGVTNMRYWINELKVVKFNDIETIKEFKEFIRYPNGSWAAREGFHDDRVMSTVWALIALHDEICSVLFEIAETDDNNRPKRIVSSDLNMNLTINPKSLYMNDELFTNDITTLPCVMGMRDEYNSEISELEQSGWQRVF